MDQYAHGNQPIQLMIYLYNYAGEPWKAQKRVRETMDRMYQPTPDGYCGDGITDKLQRGMCFSNGLLSRSSRNRRVCDGSTTFQKSNYEA